jgi:hypothetical protein
MRRLAISLFATVAAILVSQAAHCEFVVGHLGFPEVVHNDGSPAVLLTGLPPVTHESYDTFTLSADSQRVYSFANDLGGITVESWSIASGTYSGAVGPMYPFPNQAWPNNFKPNYAIGEVHTRSAFPAFGGDLLYVGPIGAAFDATPVINVVNTMSRQFVEQIVPPASVGTIYDFALGQGTLGPVSRVYVNTEDGLFVYDETSATPFIGFDPITLQPIFDQSHFQLVSTTPLPIPMSGLASFDVGPVDGYLYVLDGVASSSSIKRYNTSNGALIDTFLTFAQYNYGGVAGGNLKFGPDGGLYMSTHVPATPGISRFVVSRFDATTGMRTNDYDLGIRHSFDFYVLPVAEPSTLGGYVCALLVLCRRYRND